ncbi:MAG: AAA family ATPase [Eubacteriales bacterium]
MGIYKKGGTNIGNVILVCGLNGAGKSTLAKALAEKINSRFIDIEDIYFSKQDNPDYPYETPRPYEEIVSLLINTVNNENDFVLASVKGGFGDEFISHLRCVVSIEAPKETRLKRVYDRSYILFGEKSCKGGDFYEQIKSFHSFCESRDENLVNDWLSTVCCPIIKVDGTLPICDNVNLIAEKL